MKRHSPRGAQIGVKLVRVQAQEMSKAQELTVGGEPVETERKHMEGTDAERLQAALDSLDAEFDIGT